MGTLQIVVKGLIIISISVVIFGAPTVKIQNGTLEGTYTKTRKGREIVAFKGIPYALPPVGKLRFQTPQPASSWTGVRSAKDDASVCMQVIDIMNPRNIEKSEDCLYLNVYTPKIPNTNIEFVRTNYPVMIWIHGGGWIFGSSHSSLYSPKFLLDQDVVLVTLNYRLGPLGFLSTADEVAPGNLGLKDQVQAIRWVNENIAAFGGDPNRVTIFGESAGAGSVHYLMLSPLTKGLIHRAISQSGTALCPWALSTPETARSQAHRLGKDLNCPIDNSKRLLECLRGKDAADIIAVDQKWPIFGQDPMVPFKPTVEHNHSGAFMTRDAMESLKTGKLVDIPWMTGITSEEGSFKSVGLYASDESTRQLTKNFAKLAPIIFIYDYSCQKELQNQVTNKIRKFYLDDKDIDESTRQQVINIYSDSWFTVGADKAIREHLKTLGSPVYYYYLSYRGSNSWAPIFGGSKKDYGVCHADDLFYLFPVNELLPSTNPLTSEDEKMIDIMTTLWYNFAKTGNPTPEITPELPVKWKPVRTEALEYLSIENPEEIKMSKDLLKSRVEFWKSLPCSAGLAPFSESVYSKDEL